MRKGNNSQEKKKPEKGAKSMPMREPSPPKKK